MNNKILKSSTATYQNGVAKADGKFYVTQGEVRFEPYNERAGLGPYTLSRSAIIKIEKSVGKGAAILPLTYDAITITLENEDTYDFILANPDEWIRLLKH
ncbi:hypothetical protein KZZ04_06025 [Pseudoalteromonas sp. CR1]|uniref:hypothetical protein n=1 Tax=Pseudoalteromonas sp. CR1 TaxID=2861964 RepID=UPI001C5F2411|nr:hypothetical protein [Pseudoalteromonas sp. CR1]MBW4965921.1 hypothetical protein [Pseudoalteromonas sp. CR1]